MKRGIIQSALVLLALGLLPGLVLAQDSDAEKKSDRPTDKKSDRKSDRADDAPRREGRQRRRMPRSVLGFRVEDAAGKPVRLAKYRGKVLVIVNVASECGLTDRQYASLEKLYKKYKKAGLEILAFPANEFGKQEPGTNLEIQAFCKDKGVTFPVFSKIVVKGEKIHPLYRFLTEKKTNPEHAGEVKWNFQKYLVNRRGQVVEMLGPRVDPMDEKVTEKIEKLLAEKAPERRRGRRGRDAAGEAGDAKPSDEKPSDEKKSDSKKKDQKEEI